MFKNITKLNTFSGLVILTVLSIAIGSNNAYAQATIGTLSEPYDASREYNPGGSPYGYGQAPQNNYYQPAYVQPQPSPAPTSVGTVYSNTSNNSGTSSTKTVAKVTSKTDASTTTPATTTKTPTEDENSLAANAIFGSGTFLPSGIIQWILFAIMVLLVVILVRRIYGADQKYNAAPMKHS